MRDTKITIDDIVSVNHALREPGSSLNKLDKDGALGMSRKAFCNNAKKLGFNFNDEIKQFMQVTQGNTEVTPIEVKAVTPSNTKIIPSKKTDDLEDILKRLSRLEDIVLSNTTVTPSNFQLNDEFTKGKIITRSIKVSEDAIRAFNDFTNENMKLYKKQDLLSQALMEFVEKYKK